MSGEGSVGAGPVMEVAVGVQGPAAVVTVWGEVDSATVSRLSEAVDEALRVAGARAVVVDLNAVTFFGSQGIAALLRARDQAAAAGRDARFVARRSHRPVRRPLEVSGVAEVFALFEDQAAALAVVAPEASGGWLTG